MRFLSDLWNTGAWMTTRSVAELSYEASTFPNMLARRRRWSDSPTWRIASGTCFPPRVFVPV